MDFPLEQAQAAMDTALGLECMKVVFAPNGAGEGGRSISLNVNFQIDFEKFFIGKIMDDKTEPLNEKIAAWLAMEGYPLEYITANAFSKYDFRVFQGFYVHDPQTSTLREIDVLASSTVEIKRTHFLRIVHVMECKWSKDKPWVVFTSPHEWMLPSATIAWTIGSEVGEAILWTLAGNKTLESLDYFLSPQIPGFNGRQAFNKNSDTFYNSLQSVVSATVAEVASYDRRKQHSLEWAVLAFPTIIIDGLLFEAYLDNSGKMVINEVDRTRIHWRGAESVNGGITNIDIVTAAKLDDFVSLRASQLPILVNELSVCYEHIIEGFRTKKAAAIEIAEGPRGKMGLPPLLAKLAKHEKAKRKARRNRR